jgi:NAD(P)-dependent dehydrogenase (short-subunit alcohol dehydrogenase family)
LTETYYDAVFSEQGWQDLPVFKDLKGKTVFVTGGASGIGAYFTAAFSLQGAKVGFVSLHDEPAQKLCDGIEEKTGHRPLNIVCDINDIEKLKKSIQAVRERFGPIDILINNAARDTRHSVSDYSVEEWDNSISTNLRPQFFSIQAVVSDMEKSGAGSVINLGSNSANLGLAGYPAYTTAKAGIIGMTKSLARELGPKNIRINALVPGWVLTERQKYLWATEEDLKDCLDQQSIKRSLSGWDMVSGALFLASSASQMMTGQELIIDGGRV